MRERGTGSGAPLKADPASDAQKLCSSARALLRALHAGSASIQASAVVSLDGLIIASVLGRGVDADRFGAMCAALLALSSRAAREVERGALRQVILDGELGTMLLTRAGDVGALAVAAEKSVNLGKVIIDTRATAQRLASLRDLT